MTKRPEKAVEIDFRLWEELMRQQSMTAAHGEDGALVLKSHGSPAEELAAEKLQERWAQQYVTEHFERLGFEKIEGPFRRGPDFRVFHRRRWRWAEVETKWKNYITHGHPFNRAFKKVELLILLSAEPPPEHELLFLPRRFMHINHRHFLKWYEKTAGPEMLAKANGARVSFVAGNMLAHWTDICGEVERELATCPFCDTCPYFGNGSFQEATPYYLGLAARFVSSIAVVNGRVDLGKVKPASLKRFVEQHPPGDD